MIFSMLQIFVHSSTKLKKTPERSIRVIFKNQYQFLKILLFLFYSFLILKCAVDFFLNAILHYVSLRAEYQ